MMRRLFLVAIASKSSEVNQLMHVLGRTGYSDFARVITASKTSSYCKDVTGEMLTDKTATVTHHS